jgi:hypothetical protein
VDYLGEGATWNQLYVTMIQKDVTDFVEGSHNSVAGLFGDWGGTVPPNSTFSDDGEDQVRHTIRVYENDVEMQRIRLGFHDDE